MDDDVFAYERIINDDKEDDCLVVINRSEDYKTVDFDLDYDILDEIGIKYTPGDYGTTLEKDNGKFEVDIAPKSFMIFKMKKLVYTLSYVLKWDFTLGDFSIKYFIVKYLIAVESSIIRFFSFC